MKVRCALCNGTGTTDYEVEEREFASLPGPVPLDPFTGTRRDVVIARFGAWSGKGPEEADWKRYHEWRRVSDQVALPEFPDAVLVEYITRLRRQLVMLDEGDAEAMLGEETRRLYYQADRELRWRRRAAEKGAPPVEREGDWRDRIDRVKREVSLIALIAWENRKPSGYGDRWSCCCPFHQDDSPSLSIDEGKQVWFCHGCNVGGDALNYVMLRQGMTFWESLLYLEARLEISDGSRS